MKDCGSCTWCCFFMAVPEYDSPINQYCRHCIPDHGCNIHSSKKKVCKDFDCLWRLESQLPDYLRPDKCGVVFEPPNGCKTFVGYVDPANHKKWKNPKIQTLIYKLNQKGHPVVIFQGEKKDNIVFRIPGMSLADVRNDIYAAWSKMQ